MHARRNDTAFVSREIHFNAYRVRAGGGTARALAIVAGANVLIKLSNGNSGTKRRREPESRRDGETIAS